MEYGSIVVLKEKLEPRDLQFLEDMGCKNYPKPNTMYMVVASRVFNREESSFQFGVMLDEFMDTETCVFFNERTFREISKPHETEITYLIKEVNLNHTKPIVL